jgi:hypothetical protein
MSCDPQRFDVVIAGGGPAGLAAGLFIARYKLSTLVIDRGKSLLRQCAYLDNFLGFPGGVDVSEFLSLARAHAMEAGCRIVSRRVVALERTADGPDRFVVQTSDGESVLAGRFIAASGCETRYLRELNVPELLDDDGELHRASIDAYGRTIVEGLYVAGPLAGIENQALISAGQAAQVALGLVRDIRFAEGLCEALARHLDWQLRKGTYDSERWAEQVRAHFQDAAKAQADSDASRHHDLVERWIRAKRDQQLDRVEVARRRRRARGLRSAALVSATGAACQQAGST